MSTNLIGPDGRKYTLGSDAELDEALRQGFRVETPETPQTTIEQAKELGHDVTDVAGAATEGAARGLTFGLVNPSEAGTQGERESSESFRMRKRIADEARAREEEHPIASGAGDLAGAVLSPVNKVGALVEGPRALTAAGRIGQKMLGGAAVGALFGAGNTASEAALGDPEVTADKLIAHVGLGALLGAGGGGFGEAVSEGVTGLVSKLGRSTSGADSVLEDLANNAAIKATRSQQGVINRMGEARIDAAGKAIRSRGLLNDVAIPKPEDLLSAAEREIGNTGRELGAIKDIAEQGGAATDKAALLQRLDEFKASKNSLQQKSIGKDLEELRAAVEGPEGDSFRKLDDLRQSVAKRGKFSRGPAGVDDETLQLKRELAGVFRDEIDKQLVPQLGPDIGKHYADTKALYGALKDAAALAKSGAGRTPPSGVFGLGLYDLMTGGIGAVAHPMGMAAALASKFMRERGPAIVAKLTDQLASSPSLGVVAQSFAKTLPTTAPRLGEYAPALLNALARSPAEALATHMVMAQADPQYQNTARAAGLEPEQADQHEAALERAHGLVEIGTAASESEKTLEKHFDAIIKGSNQRTATPMNSQDFGVKRMRRDSEASHEQRVNEVHALAGNPQALLERVSGNLEKLGPVAPAVASALTARANSAVQYLAQESQVPPKAGPMAKPWSPPAAERHLFALKLEAIQEPTSILQHAARGTLVKQQMDAVRAVYPALMSSIEQRAAARLASGESIPYKARLMLSKLAGVTADGTDAPAAIRANQLAIANAGGKPSEKMGQASEGTSKLGDAQRMMTPGQRHELKEA